MQAGVYVGYNADDLISGESMRTVKAGTPTDPSKKSQEAATLVYLEELELERER